MTTPEPVSPAPEDTVTHVVMDSSDNPECIDDCPGCEPAPAPDTEALRQQVAEALNQSVSTPFANEVSLAAATDAVLALPWIKYAAGQRHVVTMHERNNAAIAETNRQFAEENAGLRAYLDRARAERDEWKQAAEAEAGLLDEANRESARVSGARPIPDDAAVDRLAARLIRLKVYGVDLPGHDERVRRQWTTVYTADEREVWRREARALLADLGLSTPITVGASATGSNVDAGSVGASTPTTDPAPAAADQPMPADEKPILAHTTGWQGVVERAALRCCDVDGRNWNLVSEADRDRYRQYGMAMFRALPPHIAGQMSAAPQAPAEPTEKPTLDQIHRFITEDTAPDLSAPAAREDAATPEAAPHDVEVTVQDDGWATDPADPTPQEEAMTDQLMTLAEAGRRLAGRDPNGCLHCFCCTKQLCEHAMLNDGSCAAFVNEGMETHVENCPCTTPTGQKGATVA